jgi:hypothetical protein
MAGAGLDVCFGSKADITTAEFYVRFAPESRRECGHRFTSALGQEQTLAAQQVGDERPAKQRSETRAHY